MATASLSMLSPNIIEYNLGSTLSVWNIARTVTASVAERIEPNIIASKNDMDTIPNKPKNPTSNLLNTNTRND